MNELLAILFNKDNYYKFKQYVNVDILPKESKQILRDLDEFYTKHTTIIDIDIESFTAWFFVVKHTHLKSEQYQLYQDIFDAIKVILTSTLSSTATEIIQSFIHRDYASRVADIAMSVAEGQPKIELTSCLPLIEEYEQKCGTAEALEKDSLITDDFDELLVEAGHGLNWRLDELNKSLGPLRKGNFIVVGKLPESGGTAFTISEATHMASQIASDEVILYFVNEEPGTALRQRVICSTINRNWAYVKANKATCVDTYNKHGGNKVKVYSAHGKSMREIENIVKFYKNKVRLIAIDQLWKVVSFDKGTNDVTRITNLFVKARRIAAEYAPVIAVHQAEGSAYNGEYIDMSQLYMSRIGIQGEADAIITIGVDPNATPMTEHDRFINIPKNKLAGGPVSEERFRHSKWKVKIVPEVSRYI